MSYTSRKEYLDRCRGRYSGRGREGKGRLLDEVCETLDISRKRAIRLLNRGAGEDPLRPGRPSKYGQDEQRVLHEIWKAAEQPCSKRLKALLPVWLPYYEKREGPLPAVLRKHLESMSPATMDRLLREVRVGRGKSATRPGRLIRSEIPIQTGRWDVDRPGYLEADTVAHCGDSLAGNFIWSISFTDIESCWTEVRGTWNRGAHGVLAQVADVERVLPFPILGFDTDNGGEFLNWHLIKYFRERKNPVKFTRSRPYHSNDNATVEQKNWTHVRQLLGYSRLEDPAKVEWINSLYTEEWSLLQNCFLPNMKLIAKVKHGGKTRRQYDAPQTPLQRLGRLRKGVSSRKVKELKEKMHESDPFDLQARIETKLKKILR